MRNVKQGFAKAELVRLGAAISVTLLIIVIVGIWVSFFWGHKPRDFFDIDYYRNAVIDVARGSKSMYDALPYPPFAFLVVSFLGGLPPLVGNELWTAGTLLTLLMIALVLAQRALRTRGTDWHQDGFGTTLRTSGGALLLLCSLPCVSQLSTGQLSLAVMAMSFVDAGAVLPRRYQGILVGLAGAIKVTPLIFVPYYLVNRLWRQAAVAIATFTAATLVGWAFFPAGSVFFWSHLGKNDVFGNPARVDNLSIHGSLARWSPALGQAPGLWEALGLIVVVAAMLRARRHFRRRERMESILVIGASAAVVAPIAWPHYFVWLPLAGMWLMMTGDRKVRWLGAGLYFVYSICYAALFLPGYRAGMVTSSPAMRSAIDLLVLIPILIAVLGLPHRNSARLTTLPILEHGLEGVEAQRRHPSSTVARSARPIP